MACRQCGGPIVGRPTSTARYCIKCVVDPDRLMKRRAYHKRSLYFTLAHSFVHAAIRHGDLRPATHHLCVDCNQPAHEYDHRDYTKPLDVEPVCRRCNQRRGGGLNATKRAA